MHEYEIITGLPKVLLKIIEEYSDPIWSERRRAKHVDDIDYAYPSNNRMFIVGITPRYGCPYFAFSGDFGWNIAKRLHREPSETTHMCGLMRRRYRVVWVGDNLVVMVVRCNITEVETLHAFGFNGTLLWSRHLSLLETPVRGHIYIEEGKPNIWFVDRKERIRSIPSSTPDEFMPPIEGIRSFAVGPTTIYVLSDLPVTRLLLLSRETKTVIDSFPLEGESHRLILTKQHLYRWFLCDGIYTLEVRSLDGTFCYQQQVEGPIIHVDDQRVILDMGTHLKECIKEGCFSIVPPRPKTRRLSISRFIGCFT